MDMKLILSLFFCRSDSDIVFLCRFAEHVVETRICWQRERLSEIFENVESFGVHDNEICGESNRSMLGVRSLQ